MSLAEDDGKRDVLSLPSGPTLLSSSPPNLECRFSATSQHAAPLGAARLGQTFVANRVSLFECNAFTGRSRSRALVTHFFPFTTRTHSRAAPVVIPPVDTRVTSLAFSSNPPATPRGPSNGPRAF